MSKVLVFRFIDSNGEAGAISMPWDGADYFRETVDHRGDPRTSEAVKRAYAAWTERETGLRVEPLVRYVDSATNGPGNRSSFMLGIVVEGDDESDPYAMTGLAEVQEGGQS